MAIVTDIFDELQWRGLVAQSTDEAALREALAEGPLTLYCGFDPTAPSLHFGNLVQLVVLRHLQRGGAPGHLPRRRLDRPHRRPEARRRSGCCKTKEHDRRLGRADPGAGAAVPRLRGRQRGAARQQPRLDGADVGARLPARRRQALPGQPDDPKEAVAARLESEQGISYTEFSYQILQALDYLELYRAHGCTLQTGGSDQWGNITAGVDLVHRVEGASVHCSRRRCSPTPTARSSASPRATPSGSTPT